MAQNMHRIDLGTSVLLLGSMFLGFLAVNGTSYVSDWFGLQRAATVNYTR
jgi:hypothetical protein